MVRRPDRCGNGAVLLGRVRASESEGAGEVERRRHILPAVSAAAVSAGAAGTAGSAVSAVEGVEGEALCASWSAPASYDLCGHLGVLQRGPHDPACRIEADGTVWRATRTPYGPATLRMTAVRRQDGADPDDEDDGECAEYTADDDCRTDDFRTKVRARAWGPGARWALERLPSLLGAEDDPSAFTPRHRLVREAHRRHPGLRLARTGLVLESLVPAVLEQKVTAEEAYRAWRLLLRWHGERAPGPHDAMYVMPDRRTWRRIPSWQWHRAGVDGKRSATILRAAARAPRLEEAATMQLADAMRRLQAIPGIGPWTAAETLQRSNGAADAITVGDLHLPRLVGYTLTGARDTDDAGMLELLAPYEGQRHRATRLITLVGRMPPRRQPRFPVRDIARL